MEKKLSFLSKLSWTIPPLSVLPSLLPLFGLGFPEYVPIFGMVYFLGSGLLALAYGLLFNFALGFLLQELRIHLEHKTGSSSDDIYQIYGRLRTAYFAGSASFLIIGFSYLIFGSWEVLLRKSSYLILIIQITVHPTFTVLILTVSRISHPHFKIDPFLTRTSVDQIHRSHDEMKVDALGGSVVSDA